jgi:hypothetical protein
MEASGSKAFPLKEAYPFAEQNGLAEAAREIRDMDTTWDRPYDSTVRRGFMIALFESKGVLTGFKEKHWAFGLTRKGEAECRRCLKVKLRFEAFKQGGSQDGSADPEDQDEEGGPSDRFALESHLRDYLAKNLERLEPGLRLYTSADSEGVEFPVDDGRIDVLSVDHQGKFVVVELKLSRGRNKALGQLLYYMGWVDKNLGNAPCRGIIVASEVTEDLVTAVSRAPGVGLYRYRLSFAVDKVGS